MEPGVQMFIYALGYTLLHSLWQGLLLFCLLFIVLKLMPSSTARAKYNLSLLVLVSMFAWFADTFLRYWSHVQGVKIIISEPVNGAVTSRTINTTLTSGNAVFGKLDVLLSHTENLFFYLVALYVIGIVFLLCRLIVNILRIQNFRRKNAIQPGSEWMDIFYNSKEQLNISKKVRLLFSEYVNVPMMIGIIKPVILVPLAAVSQLTPDQFEAIIVHELAHIKRNDYLVNILQTFLETVLFFNPFAHLVSAIIRREREHCCDDIVLASTEEPLSYASALTTLASFNHPSLAMAATGNKNQLFNRIKRMMKMRKNGSWFSIFPAVLLTLLIGFFLTWFVPVLAQSKKDKEDKTSPAAKKDSKIVISDNDDDSKIVIIDNDGEEKTYQSLDEMPPAERKRLEEKLAEVGVEVDKISAEVNKEVAQAIKESHEAIRQANKEVEQAMKDVDWTQINKEVAMAMDEARVTVNSVDINKEVEQAMKEIDWEQINKEISESVKVSEVAMVGAQQAANAARQAIAAIEWDSLGHVISEAVKSSQAAIGAINFDSLGIIISSAMDSARQEIKAAKKAKPVRPASSVSLPSPPSPPAPARAIDPVSPPSPPKPVATTDSGDPYKKMLSKMEEEGLIDRSYPYEVEKKNNKLYINGQLQADDVFRKYGKYLSDDKVKIKGDRDTYTIKIHN